MPNYKNNVDEIPANAKQCIGPLFYSLSHWICENGDFFTISSNEEIYQLMPCDMKQYYSFPADMILDNGVIEKMKSIPGIFARNGKSAKVLIRALVCYYFVDKLQLDKLTGMRAVLINKDDDISSSNLKWITDKEQTNLRMADLRSRCDSNNIYKFVDVPDDFKTEYLGWKEGYFIKKDGNRILRLTSTGNMREITIRTSNDGYQKATLTINGKEKCYNMKCLMDEIHVDMASKNVAHVKIGGIFEIIEGDDIITCIRKKINNMLTNHELTEDMLPINGQLPEATIELLSTLDPRGVGDKVLMDSITNKINNDYPCCRLLSYHGTGKSGQMVLCTNTMLVFIRSRDNLCHASRDCPLCIDYHKNEKLFRQIKTCPESAIPIYSYTPAIMAADNRNPSSFQQKYLTWTDFMKDDDSRGVFTDLRKSICGQVKGKLKQRISCLGMVLSVYPPVNGHLDESSADWILKRRIECPTMIAMMDYFNKKTK